MTLIINCYFPAERPHFFEVDIDAERAVSTLQRLIHQELKRVDHIVSRMDLHLYKSDIPLKPHEDLAQRALQWLHEQPEGARLEPVNNLGAIFPDGVSPSIVQIVVANDEVQEILNTLGDPDAQYARKVMKALNKRMNSLSSGPSPSETIKNAKTAAAFLDGEKHHVYLDQVPVAMFSPPLARLQQNIENLGSLEVFPSEIASASSLLESSIEFYDDEEQRQENIKNTINHLVGPSGEWKMTLEWADNIQPNGSWWHQEFLLIALELKNTLGISGDAVLQAVVDFSKIVSSEKFIAFRSTCNFPVILIGISGSRLQVSAGVCAGSIYVTNLLTLDLASGFHQSENIMRLARVFKAISLCRTELKAYYTDVASSNVSALTSLYPNPTHASGGALPNLTYTRLMGRSGQPTLALPVFANIKTMMYIATLDNTDKSVVVKFTARYNERAHRLLADAGFAPKLHSCSRIIGNLYMVVMDYVENGKSIWHLHEERSSIAASVPGKVEEAIHLLHEEGIVFGDLRDANVLYVKPADSGVGSVLLIDFDWAGEDGVDRYPPTLNKENKWEESVWPYGIMQKRHDLWQLGQLKVLCGQDA